MNVRPITRDDAAAVAAMAADESVLRGSPSLLQASDVLAWWERVDLGRDSWLFENAGRLVAAGWFHLYGDKGAFFGMVAQDAKGLGLGSQLVELGEARSRERGSARAHTVVLSEDPAAAALLRDRGYEQVRVFFEMAIALGGPPPPPVLPDGLLLDEFREPDARGFHDAIEEAFQDHWEYHGTPFDEWWEGRRGQHADAHGPLWFVVRDGGAIVAAVRNEADRNGGGYVGTLGVRREWRGRGLGKALLFRTFAEFWSRGVARVTLGVDAESPTGATRLYENVGMVVESAIDAYEKALV